MTTFRFEESNMNPTAIKATFCNFRNIQTRKVVQIVCEVPIEQAGQVYESLGWPDASDPKWVAICLLNENAS